MNINKIEKERTKIHIYVDGDKHYSLEIEERVCRNEKTGRELKNNPITICAIRDYYGDNMGYAKIINYCIGYTSFRELEHRFWDNLKKNETLFSMVDILPTHMGHLYIPEPMPKGYIKWVREAEGKLTRESYDNYISEQLIKNFSEEEQIFCNQLKSDYRYRQTELMTILTNDNYRKMLIKMTKNSLKKMDLNVIEKLYRCSVRDLEYYDGNRDLDYNLDNAQYMRNKEQNEKIAKELEKLSFLEDFDIGEKYCIVVPKTVRDLIAEGKQQSNCVGHYYNDSISKGENLIYFIRNKGNKEKSLITCRYATEKNTVHWNKKKTVEYKLSCNRPVESTELLEIIQKIDEEISKNLLS